MTLACHSKNRENQSADRYSDTRADIVTTASLTGNRTGKCVDRIAYPQIIAYWRGAAHSNSSRAAQLPNDVGDHGIRDHRLSISIGGTEHYTSGFQDKPFAMHLSCSVRSSWLNGLIRSMRLLRMFAIYERGRQIDDTFRSAF